MIVKRDHDKAKVSVEERENTIRSNSAENESKKVSQVCQYDHAEAKVTDKQFNSGRKSNYF